jgi:hypothetical protein
MLGLYMLDRGLPATDIVLAPQGVNLDNLG